MAKEVKTVATVQKPNGDMAVKVKALFLEYQKMTAEIERLEDKRNESVMQLKEILQKKSLRIEGFQYVPVVRMNKETGKTTTFLKRYGNLDSIDVG